MSNRAGGDGFALVAARHAMNASDGSSENYGALPSSYRRRVRKSKSIATIHNSNLRLRIQRSVPFLRHRSTTTFHKSQEPAWERHEEVVQLARAQYFGGSDQDTQVSEQYRLPETNAKEHRTFRKSVRSSEILDDSAPVSVKRSSSFSKSLRNRVRKVIDKTWNRKTSLPPQQLEAQRNYFSEFAPDSGRASGFDIYQITEEPGRGSDTFPAILENEQLEDLDKFPYNATSSASRDSLHSNARSRVTSWTNSSATGSVGLRSGPIERNRLSIIKEDGGPHQPSSSAGRHFGGVELGQEPLQAVTNSGVGIPALDSQRIYSALIKRIDEEEAEVERTRVAVENLRDENQGGTHEPAEARLTIRPVYSDSSLVTVTNDQRFGGWSGSWNVDQTNGEGPHDHQHKENSGKIRERLVEQQSRSSFFPFSSEQSPETPSPFKKFLNERRGRARSRSRSPSSERNHVQETDGGSVIVSRTASNPVMNRPRFGLSSASVYSRNTDGGSNEQYRRAIASSEELYTTENIDAQTTGMATILPATNTSYTQGSWNPWSDTVDQQQEMTHGRIPHIRERAQINSEEAEESAPLGSVSRRTSLARMDANSRSRTPKVQIVIGPDQAHSHLAKQKSADALSNISNRADDGSKGSGSLRKLSPGNLARLFKDRASQKHPRPQSAGKENSAAATEGSPPISTPGRLHLQFRNGASTGRLRKRTSEVAFQARNGGQSTPHNSSSTTPSRSHESPSENAKTYLAARLSRPFNMDVPPHNRPFDSMYLGKRTLGHPDIFGHNRLSVAQNGNNESSKESDETTALPVRSVSAGKSGAAKFGRRMVSNFLKSRRGASSIEDTLVAGGSPAFI